jgi:hypothetical protein
MAHFLSKLWHQFLMLFKTKPETKMADLHYIAKMYDPKTGEYVGKFDFVLNEIVGDKQEEEPKQ